MMSKFNFLLCRTREKLKRFSIGMSPRTDCLGVGGNDLLEKKLMGEKLKGLKETSSSDDVISPSSPPSRHEKWKLARTKPGWQMTFAKSQAIAQQIVG